MAKKKGAVKTGGRKAVTPNKITADFKKFFNDYYYSSVISGKDKDGNNTTLSRLEIINQKLYDLAVTPNSKHPEIQLKAINLIYKALGAFNTNNNIDLAIENKDTKIFVGFKVNEQR